MWLVVARCCTCQAYKRKNHNICLYMPLPVGLFIGSEPDGEDRGTNGGGLDPQLDFI